MSHQHVTYTPSAIRAASYVRQQRPIHLSRVIVTIVMLACPLNLALPKVSGEVTGDVAFLPVTALLQQENLKRIRTWQGEATIEYTRIENGEVQVHLDASAEFVLDETRDAVRWRWSTLRHEDRHDGDLVGRPTLLEEIDAMIKGKGFYKYTFGYTTREGERHKSLVIFPRERAYREKGLYQFHPKYSMTPYRRDMQDFLWYAYKHRDDPQYTPSTVRREGQLVIMEKRREGILERYTFDTDKGGALMLYENNRPDGQETFEYTFEEHTGAWVPKVETSYYEHRDAEQILVRKQRVEFVRNVVNEPIPESEFTLERLGVRPGDRVSDHLLRNANRHGVVPERGTASQETDP